MGLDTKVMRQAIFLLLLTVTLHSTACGQSKRSSCSDLTQLIKTTYNFRPASLSDAEREKKSAAMTSLWKTVEANQNELLPCLRQALEDPNADQWFRFDGSNLLVSLDPSVASRQMQIRSYATVNLDDVDLRIWTMRLAALAADGFDTSEAAARWLSYPNPRYFLPQHAAYEVKLAEGALFLFGSMDEAFATPALLKIVNQVNHPGRGVALAILANQNTPKSIAALKQLDVSTLSAPGREVMSRELNQPDVFEPRAQPKTSRKEFLDAFNAFINGNPQPFFELTREVPDGEVDVVATLTNDDLPIVRKVRRKMIASGSPHSIDYYLSFTKIIRTMVLRNRKTEAAPA
jgi:hypothetical protein